MPYGKPLGHAPRLKFSVDAKSIEEAVERDSSHCMIAESVKKMYPEAKYVSVDIQTIRFSNRKKKERYVYLTPRNAQVAIVEFDVGIHPDPFDVYVRHGVTTQFGSRKKPRAGLRASTSNGTGGPESLTLERVGGRTPPRAVGRIRNFGLRGLQA